MLSQVPVSVPRRLALPTWPRMDVVIAPRLCRKCRNASLDTHRWPKSGEPEAGGLAAGGSERRVRGRWVWGGRPEGRGSGAGGPGVAGLGRAGLGPTGAGRAGGCGAGGLETA